MKKLNFMLTLQFTQEELKNKSAVFALTEDIQEEILDEITVVLNEYDIEYNLSVQHV